MCCYEPFDNSIFCTFHKTLLVKMKIRKIWGISLSLLIIGLVGSSILPGFLTPEVDFNEEIRPILNARCMSCHGGVKKSGGLSLLTREDALQQGESGKNAIVPGNAEESELYKRLIHHDPEERMPLDAPALSEEEASIIKKWINQGANWETHWAFVPIQKPRRKYGLDYYVAKRLKKEKLSHSPEAKPAILARRSSLDLIGLPPTLSQAKALAVNYAPKTYEKWLDSLLANPHFGERWATMWLDLARYGDSQGYQKDKHRNIWQYRDWVIDAFNQDIPFDQFTVEQLAGDLLPNPSEDQLIATAFHRNTMANDEGGTDDEEFRVAAVIDRLNTTFEVFQGITMSCVQCHGHPYDPINHEEFYKAMAFFNNTADRDLASDYPVIQTLSTVQKRQITAIESWMDSLKTIGIDTLSHPDYLAFENELAGIRPSRTPIMKELGGEECRVTHVFDRGNWLVHNEEVQPDLPKLLPEFKAYYSPDRLGLAWWLVSKENPLTARVIVNRFWEQIFGMGLVETLEDFGTQGDTPPNQELLDYLAWQFMHTHNWSIKGLLKEILLSKTYRQQSSVSPSLLEKDPANRLLARGPRFRLSAEQVRDQALAVGGLLSSKMYGPSVMPPQPEGVWNVIRHVMRWRAATDENRFRRALYTYWRRSSPYPSLMTFDVPSREFCISRRIRTNTPLQALTTLNDTVYMEAAQGLARFMWEQKALSVEERLIHGYERALYDSPSPEKLDLLKACYEHAVQHFSTHPEDAKEIVYLFPDPTPEKAAYTTAANVLINLDEFINKP